MSESWSRRILRLRGKASNAWFRALELLDEGLHSRGFTWVRLCRLVGRLEPAYYERNMDWERPLYINPVREPELYLKHAASLCAHGYREGCPNGCPAARSPSRTERGKDD